MEVQGLAVATQVAGATLSLNTSRPINAATKGVLAWIRRILATVVCWSATMKVADAVAKQTATAIPGYPIVLKRRMVLRPSRHNRNRIRKAAAQMERRKTIAQLSSVVRKRAIAPPKLQTIAEVITRKMPASNPSMGL